MLLIISCQSLQLLSLTLIYLLHPKIRNSLKKITKKLQSNNSDSSVAPSGASQSTIITNSQSKEPICSWNDFLMRARNSISEENVYVVDPRRAVSESPDPVPVQNRSSLPDSKITKEAKRRHTIRDIMMGAKNESPRSSKVLAPAVAKNVANPLPKNIPNRILDDVQLFDFYYKNLNSVLIEENHPNKDRLKDDSTKESSVKFDDLLSESSSLKRISMFHPRAQQTDAF